MAIRIACSPMMTPTQHEKDEWSRMAQDAYRTMRNDVGHTSARLSQLGSFWLVKCIAALFVT